ncbi:ATP-binding cassette domain-containing protein [Listeria marthii]|uniref:ATP-binding cassette domain-containing protein n=1 Tax=Listeria marthii TaxID=529731 RepID=UPI001887BBEE|nr:ATP-binding cassette domain-containing protein [Listeria marthii]MBF2537252.1 ATP-binding cassette domain-containing protein [Listeria marthii]
MKNLKEEDVLKVIKIILSENSKNTDVIKNVFFPFNEDCLEEYFKQFHIEVDIDAFSFDKLKSDKLNIVVTKENEVMIISSFDEDTFFIDNIKKKKQKRWKDCDFKKIIHVINIQVSEHSKEKDTFVLKEIYEYLKLNRLKLLSICALMFISSILLIVMSFYFEVIFDLVIVNYLFSYLWPMTFFCFCIILLIGAIYFCTEILLSKYVINIVNQRRNILSAEMNRLVKKEYLSRVILFLNNVPTRIFTVMLKWFASLPLLFLGLLLFNYDFNLFIICLLIGALNVLIGIGFSSYSKNKYKSFMVHHVEKELNDKKHFLCTNKKNESVLNSKEIFNNILFLNWIFGLLFCLSTLVLFAYLTRMVLLDIISVGILFIYLAIALSFLLPFVLFGKLYIEMHIYEGYLEIYNSLFKYSQHRETTFWDNNKISKLRLQNVKLPNNAGTSINSMQFNFSNRELISIEGENNTGKSYLANLLTNKTETKSQVVFYDEVDLCNLGDSEKFEKKVVLLNSYVELRSGVTVLENITQGENYSEKDIYDACQEACILKFINELPNKFHTIIENNVQFSTTEKKLIRLAATLLNEAEVIVFDSFFDQFDSDEERRILENLKEVPGVKLVISKKTLNTDLFDRNFLLINGTLQSSEGVSNL